MPTSIDPQPGDDEIECAKCGAIIYHALTRCPKCGVNLYEPDLGEPTAPSRPQVNAPSAWERLKTWGRGVLGMPEPAGELFTGAAEQAALYQDLLQKVLFNRATAERLIEFERTRAPHLRRMAWIKSAIERWEKDNRADRSGRPQD